MKKSMLFAAAAVVAMVGCTNEDFTGFQQSQNGEAAINFGSGSKKITRAEKKTGKEAADLLGDNFVVLGYKGNAALSASSVKVFDYYNVNYVENTAGTTESNSSNWEYVAQEVNGLSSVTSQTIKYWDFAQTQYDFIAFSKGKQTTSTKTIDQLFTAVDLANLGTKAYTVTGTLDELKECYIADLVTVYNTSKGVTTQPSFPNGPVTPIFRKLQSKIRLAFYETIPGYSVKDVKFYESATATSAATNPTVFASDKTLAVGGETEATMEISFPTIGENKVGAEDYNQAAIEFTTLSGTGDLSSTVEFGALTYTSKEQDEQTPSDIWLGRSSNTATYAGINDEANDYAYKTVLPVGGQTGSVLNIKVDYTLESIDGSGEEITVHGATAQVPAIYTAWQPNYAYTYIFKISDQTNGVTNPDQTGYVGLYPITFDAVVEGDIDGIQETITEVGAPSITTYQQGKVVTENDEYVSGKPVYVTVDNGAAELTKDFWKAGATNLFTAAIDGDPACQGISEKSVANCVNNAGFVPSATPGTFSVKDANGKTLTLTPATFSLETEIAQADAPHGVKIDTNGSETCVAKFTPSTTGTTYVFQYLQKPATYTDVTYNTVAPDTYFAWDATNLVFETVNADGTETRTDLYSSKTDAVYYASATDGLEFNTLAKGTVFYVYDSAAKTYTKKVAAGTEIESDTYFNASFTKATGTIAANAKYYEKLGNSEVYVEKTASSAITVQDSDPYYTATPELISATSYNTLATGESDYWTAETNGNKDTYTVGKAAGDETYAGNTFVKTLPSVSNPVPTNTLPTGLKYYTGTTNDGTGTTAPAEGTADGTETSVADAKVVDTKPVYYYKVIKVQ